jgi:cobalt-precorrin 5A hydrolase
VGLGCDRGVALDTVRDAVREALVVAGACPEQVTAAASIMLKSNEGALLALAREYGWPLVFYSSEELAAVAVPNPSETVRRYTGTPSVSEAAALLVAGPNTPMASLIVEKYKHRGADDRCVTVSIVRKIHE